MGAGLIPTGELRSVTGGPFDFRQAKAIGRDIGAEDEQLKLRRGYDHNFVLKDAANDELVRPAHVTEPVSGRVLEVLTVEPGVQFYSGNFLDGGLEGKGIVHAYRNGFCMEPQHFPDSPNKPAFPPVTLRPGETGVGPGPRQDRRGPPCSVYPELPLSSSISISSMMAFILAATAR